VSVTAPLVVAFTAGGDLGDVRLNRHFGAVLEAHPKESLPAAFQYLSKTKST
jgi:hypothetical protein